MRRGTNPGIAASALRWELIAGNWIKGRTYIGFLKGVELFRAEISRVKIGGASCSILVRGLVEGLELSFVTKSGNAVMTDREV